MLHAMDQNDLFVFDDLIDDSVVATSGRVQTFQLPKERLPGALSVFHNRTEDRSKCRFSYLLRQPVQVPKTLGCDLDLIHTRSLDVVFESQCLPASGLVA